jgi:hypothetical protein
MREMRPHLGPPQFRKVRHGRGDSLHSERHEVGVGTG